MTNFKWLILIIIFSSIVGYVSSIVGNVEKQPDKFETLIVAIRHIS
jgi:hypothetical protein